MKRFKLSIFIILVNAVLFAGIAFADGGAFADENFSATIYLTTDYVSRGISFSDEDPAIQGSFDYAHPCGPFIGIWASSWDDTGYSNDIELAYYAGYSGTLKDIGYTLTANYYTYPGKRDDGFEFDYLEIIRRNIHGKMVNPIMFMERSICLSRRILFLALKQSIWMLREDKQIL